MPKQTFFNLPDEKRNTLIQIAIEEFANKPFDKVIIDNIVKKAGISKGSFYQYFENKEDIYKYLFKVVCQEKADKLRLLLTQMNNMNFSKFIRKLYLEGIDFEYNKQVYIKLNEKFLLNCSIELREEILEMLIPQSNHIFKIVLSFYQSKGELKENLDIDLTSEVLTSITIYMSKLFTSTKKTKNEKINQIENLISIFESGIIKLT